jgi:hypothetical protein
VPIKTDEAGVCVRLLLRRREGGREGSNVGRRTVAASAHISGHSSAHRNLGDGASTPSPAASNGARARRRTLSGSADGAGVDTFRNHCRRSLGRDLPHRDVPHRGHRCGRRTGMGTHGYVLVGIAIGLGVSAVGAVIFGTGAMELNSRYVFAVGSMIIGGSMIVCSVAGRVFATPISDRWEEVEGWLALGATDRQASIRLARMLAHTALLALTDRARTTGIVVLSGAFMVRYSAGSRPSRRASSKSPSLPV